MNSCCGRRCQGASPHMGPNLLGISRRSPLASSVRPNQNEAQDRGCHDLLRDFQIHVIDQHSRGIGPVS